MFIVIEIQITNDQTASNILTTHGTREEAESKFHTILSFAAVSETLIHGALIMDETGTIVKYENYDHRSSENQE